MYFTGPHRVLDFLRKLEYSDRRHSISPYLLKPHHELDSCSVQGEDAEQEEDVELVIVIAVVVHQTLLMLW